MRKTWAPLAALVLVALVPPASATPTHLDSMAVNTWYEIPNSAIQQAFVSRPYNCGSGNGTYGIMAWSGGSFDSKRDRMMVWGGGHDDYCGNETYAFDLNTLRWSVLESGSSQGSIYQDSPTGAYGDGKPTSRHTYGGQCYIPGADLLFVFSGCSWGGNCTCKDDSWTLNLAGVPTWTQRAYGYVSTTNGSNAMPDSANQSAICWQVNGPGRGFSKYTLATNTYSVITAGNPLQNSVAYGAFDPVSRTILFAGSTAAGTPTAQTWTLSSNGTTLTDDRVMSQMTGDMTPLSQLRPGLVYVPTLRKFACWAGGNYVYTYDPSTGIWSRITPGNSVTLPGMDHEGIFGRVQYSPAKNCLIVVNSYDENVWAFKLGKSGTPPPSGDTTSPAAVTDLTVPR